MVEVICIQCGDRFAVKPYRRETAKYCSPQCRGIYRGELNRRPLMERLWEKIDRRGPSDCWPWTAATSNGYGVIGFNGGVVTATRVLMAHLGKHPAGDQVVMHSCDNPSCCNPAHLSLGTKRDNTHDAIKKGRLRSANASKTHCLRGHKFTPKNTYRPKGGGRHCRQCNYIRVRAFIARAKASSD